MTKYCNPDIIDLALDGIAAANSLIVCSQQPATYAESQTYKLAEVAMAGGDYTKAAGNVSGRRTTIAGKSGVVVTGVGTATHVALVNSSSSKLLYVTTLAAGVPLSGGTIDIDPWTVEIGAPV